MKFGAFFELATKVLWQAERQNSMEISRHKLSRVSFSWHFAKPAEAWIDRKLMDAVSLYGRMSLTIARRSTAARCIRAAFCAATTRLERYFVIFNALSARKLSGYETESEDF